MKNIKLRYYLRGLGIGVLVTAFIMGTVGKDGNTMTDAQIKERAQELGMVDSGSLVLSDLRDTAEDAAQETSENNKAESEQVLSTVPEETADLEKTDTEDADVEKNDIKETGTEEADVEETDTEGEGAEAPQEAAATEPEAAKQTEPVSESEAEQPKDVPSEGESAEVSGSESRVENGIAYFEIVYGESSNRVSRVLAELGLVADAAAFDNYLCSNGYSKKIHTGSYAITVGTGEEEIAKIITGNR